MSHLQFALEKGLNVVSPHSTCVISVILSGDLSKINDPLVSVQSQKEEE